MGKRLQRAATMAASAFIGVFTGAGVASASGGVVQSDLADVSQTSLAEVKVADNSVLANSVARAIEETGSGSGIFAAFGSAPPRDFAG